MQTDDVAVITIGTGLWALGLVVALVLRNRLDQNGHGDWVWILGAGVLLGLLGIRNVRKRRAALRRYAETDPSAGTLGPNTP